MDPKRILIVDDAPEFAHLVQDALATMAIPVETTIFFSGEEAWLESLKTRFDLVITDLLLPGISGTELVRRLRSRYPNIKIIAISGLVEAGLNERTRAAGADAFYRKPLEFPLFLTKIDNLLTESGAYELNEEYHAQPVRPSKQKPPLVTVVQEEEIVTPPADLADTQELDQSMSQLLQESSAEGIALSSATGHILVGQATMENLEQRLLQLILESGAEGIVLSSATGDILVSQGSTDVFEPDSGLVETFSMLKSRQKQTGHSKTKDGSTGLVMLPCLKYDLLVTSLGKFLFWLLFPVGSLSFKSGKAIDVWNDSKNSFLPLLNLASLLSPPKNSQQPKKTIEQKQALNHPAEKAVEKGKVDTGELPELRLPKEEVDAFWDTPEPNKNGAGVSSNAITFDQASRLGLLPKEKP